MVLPGGRRASQNDLFILVRARDGNLVSIMVEGKVAETFGSTLEKWGKDASTGKQIRLKYLCDVLGLPDTPPVHIRYQLLHRAASAISEARRFHARYAMMIVHSFSPEYRWFSDYQNFPGLFGATGAPTQLVKLADSQDTQIYASRVAGRIKNR